MCQLADSWGKILDRVTSAHSVKVGKASLVRAGTWGDLLTSPEQLESGELGQTPGYLSLSSPRLMAFHLPARTPGQKGSIPSETVPPAGDKVFIHESVGNTHIANIPTL